MKKSLFGAAILFFQICGNNMVVVKNGEPYALCSTTRLSCKSLSYLELLLIRQTAKCSSFKKFEVF